MDERAARAARVIRVLVVDDSAVVRKVLARQLSRFEDIVVVGGAADAYEARELIAALQPDVLTLDVQMPRMDGLAFLDKLMSHYPLPVVVLTSLAPEHGEVVARALALGAVDALGKPTGEAMTSAFASRLAAAIRAAATTHLPDGGPHAGQGTEPGSASGVAPPPSRRATALPGHRTTSIAHDRSAHEAYEVLAIGASTGGTRAIEAVLRGLPAAAPGTVIVQHMPPAFIPTLADHLDRVCPLAVREARDGDPVLPGMALLAPGDRHMVLERRQGGLVVRLVDSPRVHFQRPSVDVLLSSVAASAGPRAIGVVLTGMGVDGAAGLLEMRRQGARTLAQDEQSCAVFGMPKEAIRLGAAGAVAPLAGIATAIIAALAGATGTRAGAGGPNGTSGRR